MDNKENKLLVIANLRKRADEEKKSADKDLERLNNNFVHELSWVCERLYKSMALHNNLTMMIDALSEEDVDAETYINEFINYLSNKLLNGRLVSRTTCFISNVTSLWDAEVSQQIISMLKWELKKIEKNEKERV